MTDYLREKAMQSLCAFSKAEPMPCPFCGSSDIAVIEDTKHHCICRDCRARTVSADTREKAIRAWNRRTQPRY